MRSTRPLTAILASGPGLFLAAGPAPAHPGHLVEAAGHNHWLAGAALGAAVVIGAWAAIRGLRRPAGEAVEPEPEAEGAEAADPRGQEA